MSNKSKLWADGKSDPVIEEFTVGQDYLLDMRLVPYDCKASIAHARMLHKIGILSTQELNSLTEELLAISEDVKQGRFKIDKSQEDCHTAIEHRLVQRLGHVGKKIHTGRSRNDQVLAALRLLYKDLLQHLQVEIRQLSLELHNFATVNAGIPLPGYTHTRKAMPSTVDLWANAYKDALDDDLRLLASVFELVDQNPLGTAAGYGSPLPLDRDFTTKQLGFSRTQKNPIYVQNSRGKFEAAMLHVAVQITYDLNRMATDMILFSMPEFGFFELSDRFCTGSSIMPHKKNPDVLELIRAKHHTVVACELQVVSITTNLISGYNRDVQLTKEPTFKGMDTALSCCKTMASVISELKVNSQRCKKAMTDELYTVADVYDMVKSGVPFRDAYHAVAAKYHHKAKKENNFS